MFLPALLAVPHCCASSSSLRNLIIAPADTAGVNLSVGRYDLVVVKATAVNLVRVSYGIIRAYKALTTVDKGLVSSYDVRV